MRRLWLLLLVAGVGWWLANPRASPGTPRTGSPVVSSRVAQAAPAPTQSGFHCTLPVRVRVGEIYPGFDFRAEAVRGALHDAIGLWQRAAPVPLFLVTDDASAIAVNLRYDGRQARTDLVRQTREDFAWELERMQERQAALEASRAATAAAARAHGREVAAYNERAAAYQQAVQAWNAGSGQRTPSAERRLRDDGTALDLERRRLENLRQELAAQQANHQRVIADLNHQADEHNRRVREAAVRDSLRKPFAVGTYEAKASAEKSIDIYHATSYPYLVAVIAHELGHALGIGHVDAAEALMNATMHAEPEGPIALAPADRRALLAVCGGRF